VPGGPNSRACQKPRSGSLQGGFFRGEVVAGFVFLFFIGIHPLVERALSLDEGLFYSGRFPTAKKVSKVSFGWGRRGGPSGGEDSGRGRNSAGGQKKKRGGSPGRSGIAAHTQKLLAQKDRFPWTWKKNKKNPRRGMWGGRDRRREPGWMSAGNFGGQGGRNQWFRAFGPGTIVPAVHGRRGILSSGGRIAQRGRRTESCCGVFSAKQGGKALGLTGPSGKSTTGTWCGDFQRGGGKIDRWRRGKKTYLPPHDIPRGSARPTVGKLFLRLRRGTGDAFAALRAAPHFLPRGGG